MVTGKSPSDEICSTTHSSIIRVTPAAVDAAIKNSAAIIVARLDAMQKAQDLFQADLTRVPTTVDRQIVGLRELLVARIESIDKDMLETRKALEAREGIVARQIDHAQAMSFGKVEELLSVTTEKFLGVAAQFAERDTRTDQRAGDTKLAVDAAFAAAKEATAKIEAGFTKQIDGMSAIIDTKTNNLSGGIGDLKERLTALEARTAGIVTGRQDVKTESQDLRGIIFGILGIMVGGAALLVTVLNFIRVHP